MVRRLVPELRIVRVGGRELAVENAVLIVWHEMLKFPLSNLI